MVVNHDLGESIQNFDDLLLLNQSVVAWGDRTQVLTQDNLYRAYGGRVVFAA
jgi:manganese/iron transport system ATP-binding protein